MWKVTGNYVYNAKLDGDKLYNNGYGLYTTCKIPSTIAVKNAKIKGSVWGWVNFDTDGIVFNHCKLEQNTYGLYTDGSATTNPTATFNECEITKNGYDVLQGYEENTLIFHKTEYDTYYNYGGGTLIET